MQYSDNMGKILINEDKLVKIINESIEKHLTESFKSNKLKAFAKQHGGLDQGNWSADMANDLYNMSDKEFDKYIPVDQKEHYDRYGLGGWDKNSYYTNNNFQPLYFRDGTFMVRKDPETAYGDRSKALAAKRSDRYAAKKDDGAKEYQYENPYLHDIINTDEKPRGNWGFKGEGNLEKQNLNPKAIKQKHILRTYGDDKYEKADDLAAGKYSEKKDSDKNIVNKTKLSRKK